MMNHEDAAKNFEPVVQGGRASLAAMWRSLYRNKELILKLARQEVLGRYQGSFLGLGWSLLSPLLMLGIYTFVFSVVFGARWTGLESTSRGSFALALFLGISIFSVFSEVVVRAPGLVLANVNYVKRVVFPLEVLPVVLLLGALFHFAINMVIWLLAALVVLPSLRWTVILMPVIVGPLVVGTAGIAWLFASLGVFLRDLGQSIGLAVTGIMFLTPIFYPASAIPGQFRTVVMLNPLAVILENARAVMIHGTVPAWGSVMASWLMACALAWLGFAWFQKTRAGFSDVL